MPLALLTPGRGRPRDTHIAGETHELVFLREEKISFEADNHISLF